jgi:hypothetical protein
MKIPSMSVNAYASRAWTLVNMISFFQNVSALTDTDKMCSMGAGVSGNIIDFTTGNGFLFGLASRNWVNSGVTAGDGALLQSAIVNSFTLTVDNSGSAESQIATIQSEWYGREMTYDQVVSGANFQSLGSNGVSSDVFLQDFEPGASNRFSLQITVDGTTISNLCWTKFSMTANNDLSTTCFDTNGKPANFRRGNPTVKLSIDIPLVDATASMFSKYADGDTISVILKNGYTSLTTTGYVEIGMLYGKLTKSPKTTRDGYEALTLDIDVYFGNTDDDYNYVIVNDGYSWGTI